MTKTYLYLQILPNGTVSATGYESSYCKYTLLFNFYLHLLFTWNTRLLVRSLLDCIYIENMYVWISVRIRFEWM